MSLEPIVKKKKLTENKKIRQYNANYLELGFIPSPSDESRPMCLICESTFSNEAMKPSRLKDHFRRMHPGNEKADFKKMKDNAEKQRIKPVFSKQDVHLVNGLTASFNISLLIAKSGKSHTIGETLILPCVKEVIETAMKQKASSVLSTIPLSNDSVSRRIDKMGENVEEQLCDILRNTDHALQVDESTVRDSEALLMGYVRYVYEKQCKEEMLFTISLPTDTRALTLFEAVKEFYTSKNIPLQNIIQCATDGAPCMIGRHRGFVALMKREIPNLISVHCVIHRQHLVAKTLNENLHHTLQFVINCVNKIKSSALRDRLFHKLCGDNDASFERLLMHTDVRWLSKGACLSRFYSLYNEVIEFFEKYDVDSERAAKLTSIKNDVAYLADIFSLFNETNKQLQGSMISMIRCKGVISSVIEKLRLFAINVGRGELRQFPNLLKNQVDSNERLVYSKHLSKLAEDMQGRFNDVITWIFHNGFCDPSLATSNMFQLNFRRLLLKYDTMMR